MRRSGVHAMVQMASLASIDDKTMLLVAKYSNIHGTKTKHTLKTDPVSQTIRPNVQTLTVFFSSCRS